MLSCGATQGHDIIRLDAEGVGGSCIERRRALASEVVPLVDAGSAAELCRMVSQQSIDNNVIEAERSQRGQSCICGSAWWAPCTMSRAASGRRSELRVDGVERGNSAVPGL
jgi:hypothetical protein